MQRFTVLLVMGLLAVAAPAQASPGELDASFGGDGKLTTDFGDYDHGSALAIQGDGKIVVAGRSGAGFGLARYRDDGSLDPAFSGDGLATGPDVPFSPRFVAIQADGKIVVAGESDTDFALARYLADGSIDRAFAGGALTTDVGGSDYAQSLAIQGDGAIVVAGSSNGNFALARYGAEGSLDVSFSSDGLVTTDLGGSDHALAVAIQGGEIVVAGVSDGDKFALARYGADGSLSGDGTVTTALGGQTANAAAIQPDGAVVVVGAITAAPTDGTFAHDDLAVTRYTADGPLDTSFGVGGRQSVDFGYGYAANDVGTALVLQADGKIVVAGWTAMVDWVFTSGRDFVLARYRPNGSPDVSFGDGGRVLTLFTDFYYDADDFILAVALQPDGKIVATGGTTGEDWSSNVALARYHGDSVDTVAPDTTIDTGPSGPTRGTAPRFTFSASTEGSTFACKLDTSAGEGNYAACSSPQAYTTTVNGPYTFSVRASHSGRTDPTPATRTFTIDTIAPDTMITGGPAGATKATTASFSFTAPAGSTFECKLDTPADPRSYAACTSPRSYTTTAKGAYKFSVRATDPAGNTDPTPAIRSFTVVKR